MYSKLRGSTLIEIAVVITILSMGIIAVYKLVFSGSTLAHTTEERIQAINLAREWIEIATNIRDTNWIKFSSNVKDCFDTKNYDGNCVTGSAASTLASATDYIPVRNGGTVWYLTGTTGATGSGIAYDTNGASVQGDDIGGITTPCSTGNRVNCKTHNFFRTIHIANGATINGLNSLVVTSTVTWIDSSSRAKPYTISFEKTLTNWKQNFKNN